MSTKTTFKRIALVAVAALGLGVLSVAPSSAAVISTTVTAGDAGANEIETSATVVVDSDSTTGTTVTVQSLFSGAAETTSVTFVQKSAPALSTVVARMIFVETTGSVNARVANASNIETGTLATALSPTDSKTAGGYFWINNTAAAGYAGGLFSISLESNTAIAVAGTYVYTVIATNYAGATQAATQYTTDVSIVVAKTADQSKTPSAVKSFANLKSSYSSAGVADAVDDAAISALATASGTPAGYVFVGNRNALAGSTTAEDSLTATVTGAGFVCIGTLGNATVGTCGKSMKIAATGDTQFVLVADGTAGVSTVSVTSSVLAKTYTKTLSYYASVPAAYTASAFTPTLRIGTNDSAVVVSAVDANGIAYTGTMYIVATAAADALIGGSITAGSACVWSTDNTKAYCPITGKTPGTASFNIINKSTAALATVTSAAVSVTVSSATAATVKVAFDKATYAPGEKAVVTVTPLDSTGNAIAVATGNYLAAALTSNVSFVSGGTSTTSLAAASVTTSAYAGTDKTAGSQSFVIYMPQASGTLTLTGKGGTTLPLAGQVVVTASADVVNSSVDAATDAANEATDAANAATDAALAAADSADAATEAAQEASDAVAELSTQVAALMASLKAQIKSLTNLVIKIQKKLK